MSDSVRLTLLKNIRTAVQAISRSTGYHNTVQSTSVVLDPEDLTRVDPSAVPFVVVGPFVPVKREYATSRPVQLKETANVTLYFAVDAVGTDKAVKQTTFENFVADLEVALAGTVALYTMSGAIEYLKILQPAEPGMGLPNQSRIVGMQPLELCWARVYGTP